MPKYSRVRPGHILAERWFAKAGLEALSDVYRRYLVERGYATQTVESYFRSVAHFVHWASPRGIAPNEVGDALIDRFIYEHLPRCHCAPRCKRTRTDIHAAVRRFLEMPSIARATPVSTMFAAIAREVSKRLTATVVDEDDNRHQSGAHHFRFDGHHCDTARSQAG